MTNYYSCSRPQAIYADTQEREIWDRKLDKRENESRKRKEIGR